MLRSRFFWKLFGGCVGMVTVTAATAAILAARGLEERTLRDTEEFLRAKAHLLRGPAARRLAAADEAGLQDEVRDLSRQISTRLTVIRASGRVVADSQEDHSQMLDHSDRPEIVAAARNGFGSSVRLSDTVHERMMYFALAMRDGDRIVGFVRTSVPLIRLDEELAGLRRTVAAAVGAGVLASLALGFLFAHRIARPLDSLTAAASSISRGNYARPVAAQGAGEVGRLVEAFNEMSDQLRDRMETITRDRDRVLAILRGMVEGVIAVDRDERVVHLNEPAGRMLGVASESAAGIRIWEVTRVPELGQALAEAVRAGADVVREMRLPAHPWERLVTLHASPLRGADGAFAGAVVVMHDVTELRRLEEVRRDFVANVSHELKTPITAVRGFVESILDDGSMDESVRRRFLERARDQVARLSALVTDLLTLSRVESQEGSLERAPLDLRGPVEASLRGLSAKAADKSLSLTPEIPQGAVTVAGDEELLREVADNLIDNAIKYTPAGGSVRVRLTVQSREAVLEVIDTGIGIEPHEQTRVFERFYRVDKARSRDLGGTGLGLSIVRHVVLAHRGTIELSSEPGRGSTFRVRIPTVLESD